MKDKETPPPNLPPRNHPFSDLLALAPGSDCMEASEIPVGQDEDEHFVWPWVGILVNVPVTCQNGKYVAESGSKLRDDLVQKGFNVVEVTLLSNDEGHSGDSIVVFTEDWAGFSNALLFDKSYGVKESRKRLYYCGFSCPEEGMFGWVAREDDYSSYGIIGKYLRKHNVLKTVSEVKALEKQKHKQLVLDLSSRNRKKKMRLEEMETRYNETSILIDSVIARNDEMHQAHIAELQNMQQDEQTFLEGISRKHQQFSLQLEDRDKELDHYKEKLKQRQVCIELEERRVRSLSEMTESTTLEQRSADENILRQVEENKRENEELSRRIKKLERQLVEKEQATLLEVKRIRCTLPTSEGDSEIRKTMSDTKKKLKETEEELEYLNSLSQVLIVKEQMTNDEVVEARKELINDLAEQSSRENPTIGVKKMGDLDKSPFFAATRNFSCDRADVTSADLWSQWVEYLNDPDWYPFKIGSDSYKTIIDEEDVRLRTLMKELGEEVYEAVTKALSEMNEYNAWGQDTVLELWNYRENRKATLHEGILNLLQKIGDFGESGSTMEGGDSDKIASTMAKTK